MTPKKAPASRKPSHVTSSGSTKEEKRQILGANAYDSHFDQKDRDLATVWGVALGSEAWVERMTAHSNHAALGRNLPLATPPLSGPIAQEVSLQEATTIFTPPIAPSAPQISITAPTLAEDKKTRVPKCKAEDEEPIPRPTARVSTSVQTKAQNYPAHLSRSHPRSQQTAPAPSLTPPGLTPLIPSATPSVSQPSAMTSDNRKFFCTYSGCPYVAKGFARNDHLRRHIGSTHQKAIKHWCKVCGAGFTRKDNCQQHERLCQQAKEME